MDAYTWYYGGRLVVVSGRGRSSYFLVDVYKNGVCPATPVFWFADALEFT